MTKTNAAIPSLSAARKQLDADGELLVRDGVEPHDIAIEKLIAPLPALRALIEPEQAAFAEHDTGLVQFDAAAGIAGELRAETLGLPTDLRVLRKRPASTLALVLTASTLLGSLHQLVRRQARGKTKRTLAERIKPRNGNSTPELIGDANAFIKEASDPTMMAAFRIKQGDLDKLRAVVSKLSGLAETQVTQGGVTDAQLDSINLKQLSLEAFYSLVAGTAGVIYYDDPKRKGQIVDLIPRSQAGRSKAESEKDPVTTTTAAPDGEAKDKPAADEMAKEKPADGEKDKPAEAPAAP